MYENQTFDTIIQRMLNNVDDDIDKREGSVIYTALAPISLSTFARESPQNVGKSFIKSYCTCCLKVR